MINKTKICFRCKEEKALSEFYKQKRMIDGVLGKCKSCTKNDSNIRYKSLKGNASFIESERERGRAKYVKYKYKGKKCRLIYDKYKSLYPEKIAARNAVGRTTKTKNGHHLHHWSYKKENRTDVIELPICVHYLLHRNIKYNKKELCYESKDGRLLDTKEKHILFINELKDHETTLSTI